MTARTSARDVSRRNFLLTSAAAGGGLALGVVLPGLRPSMAETAAEG